MALRLAKHLFDVTEYHKLTDAGIFMENDSGVKVALASRKRGWSILAKSSSDSVPIHLTESIWRLESSNEERPFHPQASAA
jgi:hypothetical protein